MQHHLYNKDFEFVKDPMQFNKNTERELLQYCLGATLYMPGTKDILEKILKRELDDVTSLVMCFEDSIKEEDVNTAEGNVIHHLDAIAENIKLKRISMDEIPLLFLRVRNIVQFQSFIHQLSPEQISVITGFIFPKFSSQNALDYLEILDQINEQSVCTVYGMPVLEGTAIAYQETRKDELLLLKNIIKPFKKLILNIRVGGTDLSSLFGVRRGINYSIYDILTVRDCLADIVNFFGRIDDRYVISGPVWEYFLAYKKDDIANLIEKDIHASLMNRSPILNEAIDGLLRELILDKANGFVGKTIIHPSHARFVNAMQAVTKEEYDDARQILETNGGVIKSKKANKMNEINPHRSWANSVYHRAMVYGVIDSELSFIKLVSGS